MFRLIDSAKMNQDFRGHAEQATYTFTVNLPDQAGGSWQAQKCLDAHITELQAQGSILLEYYLYEDKESGTFTTDYKVVLIASASPLFWAVIIVGVLLILGILVTSWALGHVSDIVQYGGSGVVWGIGAFGIGILGIGAYMLLSRRGSNVDAKTT